MPEYKDLFRKGETISTVGGVLNDRYGAPPFSILDGFSAWWQARRRAWLSLGIKSDLGRAENLLGFSPSLNSKIKIPGTSVFDPVLCELMYTWFCAPGGTIIDPFAGGSVRGVVAAIMGYEYFGVDLRPEQIEENEKQARLLRVAPNWFVGDSRKFGEAIGPDIEGDFIFSSPPYFYREHYSELPKDLNNAASYEDFIDGYGEAIAEAVHRLRPDRFACFEVNEIRAPDGIMPDFVGDTVRLFRACDARLYNHIIHVKPRGSAAVRTGMFASNRKVVPVHEHVLVFVKGSPKRAAEFVRG